MTELYVFQHFIYGCMEPWCNFVFTKEEIKSPKIQKYIRTHKFLSTKTNVYKFEEKKWTIDQVTSLKEGDGWTPRFDFTKNGLTQEDDIDFLEIFDGIKYKTRIENGKEYRWTKNIPGPNWKHILSEKKSEIEKKLNRLDYKNRELVIYRTSRRGLINWDSIGVFSIGKYHTSKDQIRKKLTLKYKKELEKQKQTIQKNKKLYKNAPQINWKRVYKKLRKEANKNPGKHILINPESLTTYKISSKEDRRRLYSDFSKSVDDNT